MSAPTDVNPPRSVCPSCGYALEGLNMPGACPECGKAVDGVPEGAKVDDHPLREIIRIAAPSVATMTSYTAMQFVDGLIVSHIEPPDPVYLAAQGNGGLAAWIPMSVMAGLLGVINTYVSQNLGAGKPERGPAYAWTGLWLALLASIAMLPLMFVLPALYQHAEHSERLIALEMQYSRILIAGAFFSMAVRGLAQFFYGMHRPSVVLLAAVTANIVNLACNWVLVYGHFGVPAMGVVGSAIGTVIGSAVELAIPLCVFLGPKWNAQYGTRKAWRWSWPHVRDILRIGWPGALMFGNEMVCWGYFMVALVGRFGEAQNTASWIGLRYMHIAFMPAVGVSFAMTAIIGRYLGMKRPDLALSRAKFGIGLTMAYMGACALCFLAFRVPMVKVFATDPGIIEAGSRIVLIAAIFQLFDALGITIVGILRGAGDTVWPGVITVVLSWSCLVGVGYVVSHAWPELGAVGPWIGGGVYIILLGIGLLYRFLRGSWRTMTVLKTPAPAH